MMTSAQVRQSFLDFFRERGHVIVPSSPVILPSDPTLLFANAGMNQFKDIFLGARTSPLPRIADTQKCIRVSGKHNDLEEVGHDTYHHTFFEMLGNWSFGDYREPEAIEWAWDLLTRVWGLPKERLWATIYRKDDAAEKIWKQVTDIHPSHILRFGEKDNFWEMGETGPCGPCSEIHFDRTPDGCQPEQVNAGSPDVIELWNLVFIQFNRRSDGGLDPLPARHIDTGMGFERVTSVLQNKASNYDTDIFTPILDGISTLSRRPYEGKDAIAMRVIADHLRTLSIAIADGALPSNEGRGYVLRRLLRRAVRYGRSLGFDRPFLGELYPALDATLGSVFPELRKEKDRILRALRAEEEGFLTTLDRGLAIFEEAARKTASAPGNTFPGAEAFKLYDTFGFPLDLTRLLAHEKGLRLDESGFEEQMALQKNRARQARRDAATPGSSDLVAELIGQGLRSEFTGYDTVETTTRILAILQDGKTRPEAATGEEADILLAETPFYAESGGQVSDLGLLQAPDAQADVLQVRKPADGLLLHRVRVREGRLIVGQTVTAKIDTVRRNQCRRHHTATHLLQAALRAAVSPSVKQAGSYVGPERLRFDFSWFEALDPDLLDRIEEQVNLWILDNRPIHLAQLPLREVQGTDILAMFDEKYGDTVRVVGVDGVSRECCGGTHVDSTGQIGAFRIVSEASIASGVRRIEAVAGTAADAAARADRKLLRTLASRFSIAPADLPERIDQTCAQLRDLEKDLRKKNERLAASQAESLLERIQTAGALPLLIENVGEIDADGLRTLMETLRSRLMSGVVLLAGTGGQKVSVAATASDDAVARGIHCGQLVSGIARLTGGGGGGKPQRAQAGGTDASRLPEALEAARIQIRTLLEGKA
jgi:alanyl-tRNA synthetase